MKRLVLLVALIAVAAPSMAANIEGDATDFPIPYLVSMYPGDYYSFYSNPLMLWPFDWDTWIFIAHGDGLFNITVEDCCLMGDTLFGFLRWYYHGLVDWGIATSPETFTLQSFVTPPGNLFIAYIGYMHTSFGYPGYYLYASFE